jgi:hypothetical protein
MSSRPTLPSAEEIGDLVPIGRIAKQTPYSADFLRRLARVGKLRTYKLHRDWLTTPDAVHDYIKSQTKRHEKALSALQAAEKAFLAVALLLVVFSITPKARAQGFSNPPPAEGAISATLHNLAAGWQDFASFYQGSWNELMAEQDALRQMSGQLAFVFGTINQPLAQGWNSLVSNLGQLDDYATNNFGTSRLAFSYSFNPPHKPYASAPVATGRVLGARTTVQVQPVQQPVSLSYIQHLITQTLQSMAVEGQLTGPQGQQGPEGAQGPAGASGSSVVNNQNGNTTAIIGGNPIVTYVPPVQENDFSGTTLSGFGDLSANSFTSGNANINGNLNVSGPVSVSSLTTSDNAAIGGTLTAATSTLSSLTVSGSVTLTGSTTIAGLTVTGFNPGLTQGSIAFQGATGLSQDNANFFYSAGSHQLGLGTTTPSQLLSVAGNMQLSGALFDSTNASGTLGMLLETSGRGTQWVATSTLGISGGGASLMTQNGLAIYNNTGYEIGVNSSTPAANLVVEGSSTNPTLPIFTVASSSGAAYLTVTANGSIGINTTGAYIGLPYSSLSAGAVDPYTDQQLNVVTQTGNAALQTGGDFTDTNASLSNADPQQTLKTNAFLTSTHNTIKQADSIAVFGNGTGAYNAGQIDGITINDNWSGTGTLGGFYGLVVAQPNQASPQGPVTQATGIDIKSQDGTDVANNTGLLIEGQGTGGGDYAIDVLGGNNNLGPNTTTAAVLNATTGFQFAGGAVAGNYLRGNGTYFVQSPLLYSDLSGAPTLNFVSLAPSGNQTIVGPNSTAALKVTQTGGAAVFTVDTTDQEIVLNGNLSLGTSAQNLVVNSTDNTDYNQGIIVNNTGNQGYSGGVFFTNIDNTTQANALASIVTDTPGVGKGELNFLTNNDTGSAQERMFISSAGNVGIGTTTPQATLAIQGSSGATKPLKLVSSTGTGLLTVDTSGNLVIAGSLTQNGSPDVAENVIVSDPTVSAGDVVMIDNSYNPPASSSTDIYDQFAVTKATSIGTVLGVISTSPGIVINSDPNVPPGSVLEPLALAGRVPVNVSDENGDIAAGDYLAASPDMPGYAVRATSSGEVIGQALGDFIPIRGQSTGTVLVLIKIGYQVIDQPASSSPWAVDFANVSDGLKTTMQDIANEAVHIFGGAIYAVDGVFDRVFAKEVHTDMLCVGQTCVTESQFLQMVQQAGVSGNPTNTPTASSTPSASSVGSVATGNNSDSSPSPTPTPTPDQDEALGDSTATGATIAPTPTPTPPLTTTTTPTPPANPTPTPTPTPVPSPSPSPAPTAVPAGAGASSVAPPTSGP